MSIARSKFPAIAVELSSVDLKVKRVSGPALTLKN